MDSSGQATIWDRCTQGVALKPDQGFPETPRIAPPRPPEWFLTSPVQTQAESCLPPTATTLNVLEPHQGPMQSTVFPS